MICFNSIPKESYQEDFGFDALQRLEQSEGLIEVTFNFQQEERLVKVTLCPIRNQSEVDLRVRAPLILLRFCWVSQERILNQWSTV